MIASTLTVVSGVVTLTTGAAASTVGAEVLDLEQVMRIRTGETGKDAL